MPPEESSLKTLEPLAADATNVWFGYKADARLSPPGAPSRLVRVTHASRPNVGDFLDRSFEGAGHE